MAGAQHGSGGPGALAWALLPSSLLEVTALLCPIPGSGAYPGQHCSTARTWPTVEKRGHRLPGEWPASLHCRGGARRSRCPAWGSGPSTRPRGVGAPLPCSGAGPWEATSQSWASPSAVPVLSKEAGALGGKIGDQVPAPPSPAPGLWQDLEAVCAEGCAPASGLNERTRERAVWPRQASALQSVKLPAMFCWGAWLCAGPRPTGQPAVCSFPLRAPVSGEQPCS